MMAEAEWLLLGGGLVAVVLGYAAVRRSRDSGWRSPVLGEWLEARAHYALAGLVLSLTAPASMREALGLGAEVGGVFLAGIAGLLVGCSFDIRLFKRLTKGLVWLEVGHGVLLILVVWLSTLALAQWSNGPWDAKDQGGVMWALCGLGVGGWVRRRVGDMGKEKNAGWVPSFGAIGGVLLAGLGLTQLRADSFVVRQPFAYPQVIVVEGVGENLLWSAVLGALVGIVVDLATREVRRGYLYFLVAGGVLLGGGMALSLGLEPIWVGAIAGVWLINATLRRLDLLRALEKGQGLVKTALPGILGWGVGSLALAGGLDWSFAGWVLGILLLGVPAVRLGVWHGTRRLLDRSVMRRTGIEPRHLLELDDLAIVIALGLAGVLPAAQGAALLAAVLGGQRLMHLVAIWSADRLGRLAGAEGGTG